MATAGVLAAKSLIPPRRNGTAHATIQSQKGGASVPETSRYYIKTYGCQMNERDSEIMAGQLELMGYQPGSGEEDADLIIVNTCAVRGSAEEHALGLIGALKRRRDENPRVKIAVAGCMTQEPATVAWIKRYAPHVDLVFGTHNLHRLPELLDEAADRDETVIDIWESAGEVVEHLPSRRASGARAYVNIIYGCDKFCTFCIVPFTRGKERSREPAAIVEEVRALGQEGFEDITVLGQNVNSYGHDLVPPVDLADLLKQLEAIDGVRWLRFMTSHPRDFSQNLIDTIAASRKISRHVHLPVQSGSDRILKRMNRKYTRDQYVDLVGRIRSAIPDVSLTTDVIVGFPGETEDDFAQTLDLVREMRYDAAFTFLYSAKAGTPAARWEGREPVPDPVKKDRLNRLMALQYDISLKANQALIGRTELVLVEGASRKDPDVWAARSHTNKVVLVPRQPGGDDWTNRFVPVRITAAKTFYLTAEPTGAPVPAPRRRVSLPMI